MMTFPWRRIAVGAVIIAGVVLAASLLRIDLWETLVTLLGTRLVVPAWAVVLAVVVYAAVRMWETFRRASRPAADRGSR